MTSGARTPHNRVMFRWLGFAVIAVWLATLAIMLTMMWDRRWMEGDPPAEVATGSMHIAAVVAGVALGLSLLAPAMRQRLSKLQMASYVLASILAIVSLSRYF